MSDDLNDLLSGECPGSVDVDKQPEKVVQKEKGFGDFKAMEAHDREVKEEREAIQTMETNRVTMQITPDGGGKFTTLTFILPRTAEEKAQLKVDLELALRYGQKYGKKE